MSNPPVDFKVSKWDGMPQVFVPEGEFPMGTDNKSFTPSYPQHMVYLNAYWIDQTEVTNGMYANCVASGVCEEYVYDLDGYNSRYSDRAHSDFPVNYVDWDNANTYCLWVNRRLPTEAEWEKAARGTDGRIYPWGNDPPNQNLMNFNMYLGVPVAVDRYWQGSSPYGALQMAGNLREWVADWFDPSYYRYSPFYNPTGPLSGTDKSLRGGSYLDDARSSFSFNRLRHDPDSAGANRGFRCAQDTD